eukprot:CAMPEP_0197191936 /NCGR_PEP_ID=MMETSP1423-20130617/24272_1 /TAXON_ID=476441 /ORGANISM="Pseudo-nitzschia heimii, Strain UNC1101" /LENGTH=436 /DNA_ID=CAMNT_0042644729 /DNA_START=95 /DNA_END=1405 /DNA_ORIENTATION=+
MTKSSASGATPSRTPARNNYAMPHTPIASAKRPRSSMDKSAMVRNHLGAAAGIPTSPLVNGSSNDEAPQTPVPTESSKFVVATPVGTTTTMDRTQLSPMHPARPTARPEEEAAEITDGIEGDQGPSKLVDVIFSPMLKFLNASEEEETERSELEVLAENDSSSILKDLESSHKTVSHEDELEENARNNEDAVADVPQDEQEDAVIVEADDGSSQGSDIDEEEEFNPYAFIKSLPDYEEVKSFCPTDRLPGKDEDAPPISLVLDLDETLVHCTVEAVDDADLTFPVEFHGMTYQVYVRLRPHLNEFLEAVADKFEVIVFTASQQVYANALLNLIDPENKYIKHRMFRESCLSVEGNFLKDLNVLGRDLRKSVLVDNSPHAFGYQVDNGIPIESWFDDRNDTELLKLERFLRTLHGVKDVRTVVRKTFQTHRLIANAP